MSENSFLPPDRSLKSIRQRIGSFRVSRDVFESADIDVLFGIMSQVIIVRCDMDYANDCLNYVGISKHFEEVCQGCVHPEYMVVIEHGDDGRIIDIRFDSMAPRVSPDVPSSGGVARSW